MDDVKGAVDFLCARPDVDRAQLAVVGYSFGAGVALRYAVDDPRLCCMVAIALVQHHYEDAFLDEERRPKLFIAGAKDPWAPADALRGYVECLRPPKTLRVIPSADHFFAGREHEVATLVADFLTAS
jgi:hypothetical protein